MPAIEARLKDVLDETRLAMLGAQLLVGIQYRAAFAPEFARLPALLRWLDGAALLLILCSVAFLLSTPSFHQITERGHATGRMVTRASAYLRRAFGPLSIALGIDVALAFHTGAGSPWSSLAGAAFVVGSALAWFAVPLYARRQRRGRDTMEDKQQSLETRIAQVLTEIRVILPGAQALFGFQVTAVLTEQFGQLPTASRTVHLVSIALVAVAVIMLIAPVAYHRIAAQGDAEEGVLSYAVRMMLPAEGLIALGLIGDAYVTIRLISGSEFLAGATTVVALLAFVVLLYGFPLMARASRSRGAP